MGKSKIKGKTKATVTEENGVQETRTDGMIEDGTAEYTVWTEQEKFTEEVDNEGGWGTSTQDVGDDAWGTAAPPPGGSWDGHQAAWPEHVPSNAKPSPSYAPTMLPTIASPLGSTKDLSAALAAAQQARETSYFGSTRPGTLVNGKKMGQNGDGISRAASTVASGYPQGAQGTASSWSFISAPMGPGTATQSAANLHAMRPDGPRMLSTIHSEEEGRTLPPGSAALHPGSKTSYLPLHAKSTFLPYEPVGPIQSANPPRMATGPLPAAAANFSPSQINAMLMGTASPTPAAPFFPSNVTSAIFGGPLGIDDSYPRAMSRAEQMTHGYRVGDDFEDDDDELIDTPLHESNREALIDANHALFGSHRPSAERLYWSLDPKHNDAVWDLLSWVEEMRVPIGRMAIDKFLQFRQRGVLLTNAAYRAPNQINEPSFDWITFEESRGTMDKVFQEGIAGYDPRQICVVYVFLVSASGNSVAIWRRKIPLTRGLRQVFGTELERAWKEASRKKTVVAVEKIPPIAHRKSKSVPATSGYQPVSILRNASIINPAKPVPYHPIDLGPMVPSKAGIPMTTTTTKTTVHEKRTSAPVAARETHTRLKKGDTRTVKPAKKPKRGLFDKLFGLNK